MITTVDASNIVTIPAELVTALGIQIGTRIQWEIESENTLIVRVLPTRGELARLAQGMGRAWLKEGEDPIAELIAERAEEDYLEGLE